mgnify:CR=1 FL=1
MCNCKTLFGVSKEAFHGVTQSFYFSENKLLLQLVKLIATLAFCLFMRRNGSHLHGYCSGEYKNPLSKFHRSSQEHADKTYRLPPGSCWNSSAHTSDILSACRGLPPLQFRLSCGSYREVSRILPEAV